MFLYLTLYMQEILGYCPLAAGLRFLPLTMLAFVVAPVAGKLTVRVQTRYLMGAGLVLVAIGCQLMTDVHGDSSWTVLLPGFLVCRPRHRHRQPGAGLGGRVGGPTRAERHGVGTASTFRQVGIATGIAGLGAIFVHEITPAVVANLKASAAGQAVLAHGGQGLGTALASGSIRQAAATLPSAAGRQALLTAYQDGFASTFNHLMGIAALIALVGAVGCLFLVRQKDFVPSVAVGEWSTPATVDGGGDHATDGVGPAGTLSATDGDDGPSRPSRPHRVVPMTGAEPLADRGPDEPHPARLASDHPRPGRDPGRPPHRPAGGGRVLRRPRHRLPGDDLRVPGLPRHVL